MDRFLCDNVVFIGIKDCCAILVKTYGNLYCGSIEALTLALPNAPALILPWAVVLWVGSAEISVLFPAKISQAG
ncbi:hypothetical protein [Pedobacter sp.]|uniref:hypothetical protein n=1 Tax=Pedobacter sp. TaxID=1411316 RepID=UPI0031D86981